MSGMFFGQQFVQTDTACRFAFSDHDESGLDLHQRVVVEQPATLATRQRIQTHDRSRSK